MQFDLLFLINVCVNAVIAILLWYGLPARLRQPKWAVILFFVSIAVFLPVVGILFLIVAVILSYWFTRKKAEKIIQAKELPTYKREKIISPVSFGVGGAWTRLYNAEIVTADRLQAMFTINAAQNAVANNLNLNMLHEKNDQLRLYAFGLLSKQTKKLDKRISELKQKLLTAKSLIEQSEIKKNLAFSYWEFIYLDLVHADLSIYIEAKVLQYTQEALKQMPNDAGLWVLLGKIYFHKKDYANAKDAFEHAGKLHAPCENVSIYLAEIYFEQRDFAKVREYCKRCDIVGSASKTYAIIKFWGVS
ncbi:MAG: hypothetical protein PVG30_07140 [Gammaproteobacteria bacterium]|jgi:tetratricopeptide (TPR) repeat protein